MTSSNGNIFRVTGPLCGEFTGHRWIPLTKASDAEFYVSLICTWKNGWVNNRQASDLRRHCAHYDVTIMFIGEWWVAVVPLAMWSIYWCNNVYIYILMTVPNLSRDCNNVRFQWVGIYQWLCLGVDQLEVIINYSGKVSVGLISGRLMRPCFTFIRWQLRTQLAIDSIRGNHVSVSNQMPVPVNDLCFCHCIISWYACPLYLCTFIPSSDPVTICHPIKTKLHCVFHHCRSRISFFAKPFWQRSYTKLFPNV